MNKKLLKEFQLHAGGSHYPSINPQMQEEFARLIIDECIRVVKETGTQCAFTTYDLGIVQCTINKCAESIKERFEV